jgi:hypothetical protein
MGGEAVHDTNILIDTMVQAVNANNLGQIVLDDAAPVLVNTCHLYLDQTIALWSALGCCVMS